MSGAQAAQSLKADRSLQQAKAKLRLSRFQGPESWGVVDLLLATPATSRRVPRFALSPISNLSPSLYTHNWGAMGFFNGEKEKSGDVSPSQSQEPVEGFVSENADQLQRHLANRQIQLIAIGGSIGTALFVSIGGGLYHGGAASLLIAYTVQSCILAMVNNCVAEMSTAYPVSGGFIRLAGKWVDEALGFMVGWNFLLADASVRGGIVLIANVCSFYEALLIPFEISAFTLVVSFWSDEVTKPGPIAGIIIGIIICYA